MTGGHMDTVPAQGTGVEDVLSDAETVAHAVVGQVKPRFRGWLHAGITPFALAAGIVLILRAPTAPGRLGGAAFLAASLMLFGTSGL
ncbi:hypothetical protein [Microlunatus sp. Gsoil 973]|uniref:hypothetical protein n=1 Tax=Microlunatus sp. Gsoil 973 TaxID=2672569 RepID=UPI00351B8B46